MRYFVITEVLIAVSSIYFVILSAVMKRKGRIFIQLQRFKKNRYPQFIKEILLGSGFDTAAALRCIKKSTIAEIEKFVSNRTDLLKGTDYVDDQNRLKNTPFKFMLGHEILILSFPEDIKEYYNSEKKERKSEIPPIDELKLSFAERTERFARSKNIALTLNSEELSKLVSKFEKSDNSVKCQVKCPFCNVKTNCLFDSSWKLSNFNKHIISCTKKNATQNITGLRIERAQPTAVLKELKNALP